MRSFSEKTMLVGIGAQKTGTTWLYEYLTKHNDVFMTPYKEAHVFDHRHNYSADKFRDILLKRVINLSTDINKRKGKRCSEQYRRVINTIEKIAMIDDLGIYMEHFQQRVKQEKIFGEITPAYSLLPKKGFKEILSLHPKVKFIFIMRDPVDRAWSHINDESERKGIRLSEQEKIEKIFNTSNKNRNAYYLKSNYEGTIKTLEAVVPQENILYLFYENLFCVESVEKICSFLGIDYLKADFSKRVNQGKYNTGLSLENVRNDNIYNPIYEFCQSRFGDEVQNLWRKPA